MIIYKATNKIDGKCYIGQTIHSLKRRKTDHLWSKDNCYFHNAIQKYGWNNFEWKVIEECSSEEELNEMEFHYIKQYNSFRPNGYNLTMGGRGIRGYKHSEKTKRKIKKARSKQIMNPCPYEQRIALSKNQMGENNTFYGKKHSEESKEKMSKSKKGCKRPDLKGKTYEELYGVERAKEMKRKIFKTKR